MTEPCIYLTQKILKEYKPEVVKTLRSFLVQDTVVALQAISSVATQTFNADINMKIVVEHGGEKSNTVNINADNMDVLQYIDVCFFDDINMACILFNVFFSTER